MSNYRPILNLSTASKVIERLGVWTSLDLTCSTRQTSCAYSRLTVPARELHGDRTSTVHCTRDGQRLHCCRQQEGNRVAWSVWTFRRLLTLSTTFNVFISHLQYDFGVDGAAACQLAPLMPDRLRAVHKAQPTHVRYSTSQCDVWCAAGIRTQTAALHCVRRTSR